MAEGGAIFSLEEDECNDMFITQEPKDLGGDCGNVNIGNFNSDEGMLLGLSPTDFHSPCSSLINRKESGIYSDISDDEGVFQCSQISPIIR